jgi:serine/threonine protein kinase
MDESISNRVQDCADESGDIKPADELVDTIFDQNYLILKCLGRGASGVVYKAKDLAFDRIVAIKLFNPRTVDIPRLKIEAQSLLALDHPNIVRIYSVGVCQKGRPYLACEYVDGINLWSYISKHQLACETMFAILDQVAAALQYVHSQGTIHRDIKSGNVVVSNLADGSPIAKLIDFGCAKNLDLAHASSQQITKTGQFLGTAAYASPEQIRGEVVDHRTDIYSFGMLIAEVCSIEGSLRPELKLIVERATSHRKVARYNSIEELRQELSASQNATKRKRKLTGSPPFKLFLALLLAALIPAIGLWIYSNVDAASRQARLDRMTMLAKELETDQQIGDAQLATMSKEVLALSEQLPVTEHTAKTLSSFVEATGVRRVPELASVFARACALRNELRMKTDYTYFAYKIRELECLKKDPSRWNEIKERISTDLAALDQHYDPRLFGAPKERMRQCYIVLRANVQELEGNHAGSVATLQAEWTKVKDPQTKALLAYMLAATLSSAGAYNDAIPFVREAVSYYSDHYTDGQTALAARQLYKEISRELSKKTQQ